MRRLSIAIAMTVALVAGCGDKVPESQAARRVGEAPKQVVDKAAADTAKAMEQAAARNREAD
jgi:hypothetical protein